MVKGPHKTVQYRRDREGKTDYHYRRRMLKSGKPRLIARISLKHVRTQVADPDPEGDEILASAFSKELSELGWKANTSNTSSAYLVGLLCGYRALEVGVKECVLDIDKFVASPQAKIFAVLKGALDAGLSISHDEDVLPSEERIRGEHISNYAEDLEGEKYESQFSNYLENDLEPEDLPEHFKEVKEAIQTQCGV
ncbi:50S ribosomal protein L18 [candidate division MSBL1 archaeon SCGC-AAA382C18]|uniref:Large ribosomal subunit protein uL18 n=1 Tax=candidate division MSBL1 archaeon SCGC-AAA382C18 TaxID=1698281 RepID=A0A133VJH7_9EURY|nr:50S ribosomal protein L18 [candidate division MSBL1 archaeon SCGC-AAA382C18]